jgi:LPXTG-motif cell wall-anchored protein
MSYSFGRSVRAVAKTAVFVFGSLIWGPVLVAASLWVWFAIGTESAVTIVMGLLGVLMTIVGLLVRRRSKDLG